jgi:hypothetical protein
VASADISHLNFESTSQKPRPLARSKLSFDPDNSQTWQVLLLKRNIQQKAKNLGPRISRRQDSLLSGAGRRGPGALGRQQIIEHRHEELIRGQQCSIEQIQSRLEEAMRRASLATTSSVAFHL